MTNIHRLFFLGSTLALWAPQALATDFVALDRYLQDAVVTHRIPGLAVSVVEGDEITFVKGYGIADPSGRRVTPQTPFILGSTSKSMTALAVLQLVEQGRLDLDAPVAAYLPWLTLTDERGMPNASQHVTLRHLLHHTSGIPNAAGEDALTVDDRRADALDRQVHALCGTRLLFAPGAAMQYANANYQICGLIVQTASRQSLEDYMAEHVFSPLGMTQSYARRDLAGAGGLATGYRYWFALPFSFKRQPFPRGCIPSGFLISSAEDLGHYLAAHMNGGAWRGAQVLSRQGIAELHRPGLNGYAMGWEVRAGVLEHGGHTSCYGSHLLIDTEHRRGVAVLFNVNRGVRLQALYDLAPSAALILDGRDPISRRNDREYRTSLLLLLALLVGGTAWFCWSFVRLRGWHTRRRPGLPSFWLHGVLPAAFELSVVGVVFASIPVHVGIAVLHSPDLLLLSGALVALLVGWSLARTVWVIWLRRRRGESH